ncbi:hypothetical protein Gotur_031829 [Gossypium turneri]
MNLLSFIILPISFPLFQSLIKQARVGGRGRSLHAINYQVTNWVFSLTNVLSYGMYRDLVILCVCHYVMAKE